MKNMCNTLSSDAQSSVVDYIDLQNTNDYQRKIYQNRYWHACSCIKHNFILRNTHSANVFRILDAATGTGAGAAYLAEQLAGMHAHLEVVGVDIEERAIAVARERYSRYASFHPKDIVEAANDHPWDVVVSMETLEHVTQETMHAFLSALSTHLAPGGVFICSSPRRRPRETTVKRPGHINELYYQEFKLTLGEYFPRIEFASMDRYGNLVGDCEDANLMLAACYVPPATEIFP